MLRALLQTKLTIPVTTGDGIKRPRLNDALDQAWHRPLTTLIAPAGFGKTTAVLHWLTASPSRKISWLSLDERDNDPLRYMSYLVTALSNLADHETRYGLSLLESGGTGEAALTAVLNDLHQLSDAALLVLDDFHLLDESSVREATRFLLDHLPPQLHLLITSRQKLPFPLGRWRAQRQLVEITAAGLRFTAAETAQFFNQLHHLNLPPSASDLLTSKTEGWAAGLQLAALSLEQTPAEALTHFLDSFGGNNTHIATYLLEEAWRHQSAEQQTFLLYTSLFERFSLELCQAVLPSDLSAAELFTTIQAANLFIVPLDSQQYWFRYHHLFRDFLRRQLSRFTIDVEALHRQAAAALIEQQLYDEAMAHLTTAEAWDDAAALVIRVGFDQFVSGQTYLVQRWLASLPEQVIQSNAYLSMYQSVIRMNQFRLEEAERYLQFAERHLEDLPQQEARVLVGQIAAGRAGNANLVGDVDQIWRQTKIALAYLPPEALGMRATVAYSLGFAHLHGGDFPAAIRHFQQAAALAEESENWQFFVMAQVQLGYLHNVCGEMRQAAEACQKLIDLYQAPQPVISPMIGLAYTGMAVIAWEANQLDEALALIQTGVELCQLVLNPQSLLSTYVTLIYLLILRQEHDLARQRLAEAEKVVAKQPHELWMRGMLAAATAAVQAAEGDFAPAVVWLQSLNPDPAISSEGLNATLQAYLLSVQLDVAVFVYMRWALAMDTAAVWQAAVQMFGAQRQQMAALGFVYPQARLMAVEALALAKLGNMTQAQAILAELLTLSEPRSYILLFVRWGRPMWELLQTAAESVPYARILLTHFDEPPVLLLDDLTPREEEVLTLIAAGLTNQQIADQLHITYGTTKRHVNSIYSKLDVNSRPQAILKAQELGVG